MTILGDRVSKKMSVPIAATANKMLWQFSLPGLHGDRNIKVTSLSPSDAQLQKFYYEIGSKMPEVKQTRRRAVPQDPNMLSAVIWIDVEGERILLGADLEEHNSAELGWTAILDSKEKPPGLARIFKIPHHGSENGHHPGVWSEMIHSESPLALVAPYSRSKLPKKSDVERISGFAQRAFCSSDGSSKKPIKRRKSVERTISEGGVQLARLPELGFVQLRNGGETNPSVWQHVLYGNACELAAFKCAA